MATSNSNNGLDGQNRQKILNASPDVRGMENGIANSAKVEPIPIRLQAEAETIVQSTKVNAHIVLGNDRIGNLAHGHGGKGDTKCATIDIVAGTLSPAPINLNNNGDTIYVNPNIKADAARIYISQMTDIDDNFELVDGSIGNSKNKSAIAMKADGVRIIAREGIKLVTKTDFANSKGNETIENHGVEIIALNDDSNLQPMVLGDNLVDCINEIIDEINKLQNRTAYFIKAQQDFNNKLSNHVHISPFSAIPTLPAAELMLENMKLTVKKLLNHDKGFYFQMANFNGIKTKYLSNTPDSIKSKYNKVN